MVQFEHLLPKSKRPAWLFDFMRKVRELCNEDFTIAGINIGFNETEERAFIRKTFQEQVYYHRQSAYPVGTWYQLVEYDDCFDIKSLMKGNVILRMFIK